MTLDPWSLSHDYLYFDSRMLKDSVMKNIQNLIKNKPVEYVERMNHLYSNGPKPKGDVVQQLLDLKEWSQDSARYERRLNFRAGQAKKKEQAEALKNSKKWINNPKKLEAFIKSEDPVPRAATPKTVKVAGIKDSSLYKTLKDPSVIGFDLGHDTILEVINLIQNLGLVKKPEPEPAIPIEEKIRRFAQAKQNNTEQVGVASLLGIPKRFNR